MKNRCHGIARDGWIRVWCVVVALGSHPLVPAAPASASLESPAAETRFRLDPRRASAVQLRDARDVRALREAVLLELERARSFQEGERAKQAALLGDGALAELPADALRNYFTSVAESSNKRVRGWQEVERRCRAWLALSPAQREEQLEHQRWIREVLQSLANERRSPTPASLDIFQFPIVFVDYARNPIGTGADADERAQVDRERERKASSFRSDSTEPASANLYAGFGRATLPDFQSATWDYAGPKLSYGTYPGFEATDGRRRLKIKFGETTSEPFAARVFHALGYHVEPTDHVSSLKLRYTRRFFREFHLRKPLTTRVTLLGVIPVWRIQFQKRHDPFHYVQSAVLQSGERWSGEQLRQRLLKNTALEHPEDDPGNFRTEIEALLDYLVLVPANVQSETDDRAARSLGPWSFEGLGHEDERELRGVGLLGAWIGWCDSRFENTRLKIVRTGSGSTLRHYFTDLGGGLGKAVGPISRYCEAPNDFPWFFTRPERRQGPGRMTIPFRIVGYEPIEDTRAFEKMTTADARWMARQIGALSEAQIVQALVASGFASSWVKLFAEKLVARRDQMIRDLGLVGAIPLLRPEGVDLSFCYDPSQEGPIKVRLPSGDWMQAWDDGMAVHRGLLVPGGGAGHAGCGVAPREPGTGGTIARDGGGRVPP